MSAFNYLLFTTCDANPERIKDLLRLIDSIDNSVRDDGLNIKHYILLQRAAAMPEQLVSRQVQHREYILVNSRLSLSRARNVMLHAAKNDGAFEQADICAFPDDDAWYPSGFLTALKDVFLREKEMAIFTCDYGSQPVSKINGVPDLQAQDISNNCSSYIRTVSSNTMFFKSEVAKSGGYFDEMLGVGAPINGGEDLDYALRAYLVSGKRVKMSKLKLVGHRDRMLWVRSKYFSGSLYAIARSARSDSCVFAQMVRKVLVGFYFTLKREISLAEYCKGLKEGLAGFNQSEVKVDRFIS